MEADNLEEAEVQAEAGNPIQNLFFQNTREQPLTSSSEAGDCCLVYLKNK